MTDINAFGPQNTAKLAAAMQRDVDTIPACVPEFVLQAPPDIKAAKQRVRREHLQAVTFTDQVNAAIRMGRPGANMIFAIPNGTAAGAKIGADMVKEGVRKGVPDYFVAAPRGDWHGLFIELKLADGVPSDCSAEQQEWLARLSAVGYDTEVAYGWRHAWRVVCEYLGWAEML